MTTGGWLSRIAEADAGLPDAEAAARILAAGDPGTARILEALAATRADLRALPPARMPTTVAEALAAGFDGIDAAAVGERPAHAGRGDGPEVGTAGTGRAAGPGWDVGSSRNESGSAVRAAATDADQASGSAITAAAAAAGEESGPAITATACDESGSALASPRIHTVDDPRSTAARATRPRRRRRTLVLTAAAAALVAVVLTGPPPTSPPADLASAAGRVLAERTRDVGGLADPAVLASCLRRAGVAAPHGPLLAGRPVRVDGTDGTLLVIATGTKGRVRAVVATPDCTTVLADLTVGG
jgi:hypothetical protein